MTVIARASRETAHVGWADHARDRPHASGTILIVEDKVPEFDKHAGGNCIFHYVRILVEHDFKVIFLPDDRYARQPYAGILQRWGVEVLYGHFDFDEWLTAHGPEIDWVFLARPTVAPHYIDAVRRRTQAKLLYFTVDLHFLRELRRYEALGDVTALRESKRLQLIEQRIFRQVDVALTPSPDEVPVIESLARGLTVRAIPLNAIRIELNDEAWPGPSIDRQEIIFVGGFGHYPNIDATRWLVETIMPMVWREVPEARVLLVGSNPTPDVLALAGPAVSVLGYVPHLAPYYARARMSVSPLRFGAGIKGKVISSLEAGVPVVTTEIGNEGIGLVPGVEALIADTAEEIAIHVIRLCRDEELVRSLSVAGRQFVVDRFGEEVTRDALLAALGLAFCSVCGHRMAKGGQDGDRTRDGSGTRPCPHCAADAVISRLADIIVRPYRRSGAASVREALRYLAGMRIRGVNVGTPLRDLLSTCRSFTDHGSGANTGDPVDLICGVLYPSEFVQDAGLEIIMEGLRVGGRAAFVVHNGHGELPTTVSGPDPAVVVARLEAAGFRAQSDSRPLVGYGGRIVAIEAVRKA